MRSLSRRWHIFLLTLLYGTVYGQLNFNVNKFSGSKTSFGINVVTRGGVTKLTPGNSINGLDVNDLYAYLKKGDVVLENLSGSVIFTQGVFEPKGDLCKLTIISKSDVDFSTTYTNTSNLDLDIKSQGVIWIHGPGIAGNSNQIHLEGKSVYIRETGIVSNSGDIEVCAKDSIFISGSGIRAIHSNIQLDCTDLIVERNGIHNQNGKCRINIGRFGQIGGVGIHAKYFSASGNSLTIGGDGVNVSKWAILNFDGDVKVFEEGIKLTGGALYIKAKNLTIGGDEDRGGSGIQTFGGSVNLDIAQNLLVQARGVFAGNGKVYAVAGQDVVVKFGGITTNNGDIFLESKNGKITLGGMNLNSKIDRKTTGGKLDTSRISNKNLILLTEPVVGGGDITIITKRS
ncbi:MAG: hypothetical protein KDC49_20690 [Saprospiraceae bacterium]|nr:hypothetical protein [Saprospiraceae bacterium]